MRSAGLVLLGVALLCGAQPKLIDAKLESRAARGSLAQEIAGIDGPAWLAYQIPTAEGERFSCDTRGWREDYRERLPAVASPARLEGYREAYIFIRVENRQIAKLRNFSPDCEIDAGGLPVTWLGTSVAPAASVAFLKFIALGEWKYAEAAVTAIALHAAAEADVALEDFVKAGQSDKLRRKAAFWLGSTRKQRGADLLSRLLREDPGESFRQHVAFALSQSKEGVPVLIDYARLAGGDKKVREKAVFWLARSADPAAKRFIEEVLR